MNDFDYIYPTTSGPDLNIASFEGMADHVWVSSNHQPGGIGSYIPKADAPTVAAELLKAAGQDVLAQLLADVLEQNEAALKRAAEKELQERRDAITREIMRNDDDLPVTDYASLTWYAQKAVDRIIELEDGKADA